MSIDILSRLNAARTELLDLGLRNPLINFRTRLRKIDVVDELSAEVCRILVTEGKAMTLIPALIKSQDENGQDVLELFDESDPSSKMIFADGDEGEENGIAKRHIDVKLQTRLSPASLLAKLLTLHNDAQTYIEEQGVNILFLALGFLHWYESESSDDEHRAPLILVPVELSRSSARERFFITYNGEEIEANLSLYEKLKREFSIKLPNLISDEDISITKYFSAVNKKIEGQARWRIAQNEIVLGFFSFGKFLMYKDLAVDAWPKESSLSDHPILTAILGEGFRESSPMVSEDTKLDALLSPDDVRQVLDADSSQIIAILNINAGHNMVIQGPPGTGKSQTIANIIAESIGLGKKVLFVSEKMAALEVVKRRLDRVGLGDAVLELHSNKTHKKSVLSELDRTLHLGKPKTQSVADDIEALRTVRDRLNDYCEAVNTPILNTKVPPVKAIGQYLTLGKDAPSLQRLDFTAMRSWTDSVYKQNRLRVDELQRRLSTIGIPEKNPFWGSQRTVLLPSDERYLSQLLQEAYVLTESISSAARELSELLRLQTAKNADEVSIICRAAIRASEAPHLEGVRLSSKEWQARRDDLTHLIDAGSKLTNLHKNFDSKLSPDAWTQDLTTERQIFMAYGKKWWRFLISNYRQAKRRLSGLCKESLPKNADHCLAMIDAILEARQQQEIYKQFEVVGSQLFGAQWQGMGSDWSVLSRIIEWIVELYRDIGEGQLPSGIIGFLEGSPKLHDLRTKVDEILSGLKSQTDKLNELISELQMGLEPKSQRNEQSQPLTSLLFPEQLQLLSTWIEHFDEIHKMVSFNVIASEFKNLNLDFVLSLAASWDRAKDDLLRAFDATWYGGLIEAAYVDRPALRQFNQEGHEHAIESFRKLDCLLFQHSQIRLAQQHWNQLPNIQHGGELNVIRREINKKRRHLPIRRLMGEAGRAIQSIKPVFMMSPMSIANFIPPGALDFDLLIFDEASQVKPVDAFGAILRSKQVVVVGDSKQLPPTSFFDTLVEITDEAEEQTNVTAEMESILGLFLAQNAPECMLRWHYRSRHDSLITVSNHEFYEDRLMVFPSPGANPIAKGLVFCHLPQTYYDRGKTSANIEEARAIAQAVMEHAKTNQELTLGVAAFSIRQRDSILAQLELLRRRDPSCEDFFNAHSSEPFFVKNLENVQGDERDVIFISVGYGKTKEGYLSMNFGPLNREGGERRLNVLITRARLMCEVFANFTAEDMDLERSNTEGVRALKTFLAYAKDRFIETPKPPLGEPESIFEAQVAQSLSATGYNVKHQVGSAGFRVDIGVLDDSKPGRYLIGLECDGATYHSARCARDRDRLRQEVLEGLGWRIHRIWSSDWFRSPERELSKVVEAIEKAKVFWVGVDNGDCTDNKIQKRVRTRVERSNETKQASQAKEVVPYKIISSVFGNLRSKPLHLLSSSELVGFIEQITEVEGPVHCDVITKRICDLAGLRRAGARIQQSVQNGIRHAAQLEKIKLQGNFAWSPNNRNLKVRDRSLIDQTEKKLQWVAPEEIMLALENTVVSSFSIHRDEAISHCLDLLGFKRATAGLCEVVDSVLGDLIRQGRMQISANILSAGNQTN
jgi:very-short-patch-repair endonuclease